MARKRDSQKKSSDKIESIFTDAISLNNAKTRIASLNKNERKELKAILNNSSRNDLKNRLSSKDISSLLKLLEEYEKETPSLLGVEELRPASWTKTVTIFDVYETDEENFIPYISPLATVGTLPSSGTSSSTTEETAPTDEALAGAMSTDTTSQQEEGHWYDSIVNVVTGGQ